MAEDEPGPDERYCASCGEVIKEDAEICPECGVRQKAAPGGVDVMDAISDGLRRTLERNGLILVAIWSVLQFVSIVANNTLGQNAAEQLGGTGMGMGSAGMGPLGSDMTGITAPIPSSVAGLLVVLVAVAGLVLTLVAIRVFVSDETERIPEEFYTHNIVMGVLNLFVGGLVFGLAVFVGLILLVIPGLFLLVSLIFYQFYIAAEDENFVEGLKRSWDLAGGHRLSIFLVILVAGLIFVAPGIVIGAAFFVSPPVANVLSAVVNGFATVFTLAALASVYRSLAGIETAS